MNLFIQAAHLVVVIQAWMLSIHQREKFVAIRGLPHICSMFERDIAMMVNLNYIYNNNDGADAINILWMRRSPFINHLVITFRVRGCFKLASTPVSKRK
jgi:hypothetical protein